MKKIYHQLRILSVTEIQLVHYRFWHLFLQKLKSGLNISIKKKPIFVLQAVINEESLVRHLRNILIQTSGPHTKNRTTPSYLHGQQKASILVFNMMTRIGLNHFPSDED
jgi:hypothetical protein